MGHEIDMAEEADIQERINGPTSCAVAGEGEQRARRRCGRR